MKWISCIVIILLVFNINNVQAINDYENHWAKENIDRMITNKKINGYPDGSFKPDLEVTTLEFIKIILNTLDIELVEEGIREWPDYYIATAKLYNLPTNYYEKLTRYEAVQIISRIVELKDVTISNNKFKDLNSKNRIDVLKLVKLKIVNGYEDKTFRGEQTLTRAEAITIALRTLDSTSKIYSEKKYKITEKHTNIGFENLANDEIEKIRYEIKNKKIYFRDNGRFSNLIDYTIDEKYVSNKKLIKLIETLMTENSYTAVYYVPSKYIINQVIIKFGENDSLINKGLEYFSFTYYEDKLYDLQRVTLKEDLSNECYLKISIDKLWRELYKFEKGEFIDENINLKFYKALQIEFENDAQKILDYMIDKYIKIMNNEEVMVETKIIGKYKINFYKTDATSLDFYFEKLSS